MNRQNLQISSILLAGVDNMKIRPIVVVALAVLLAVAGGAAAAEAHVAAAPPNIVVFLVDDMGVMDTSVPFLTDAAGEPQRFPLNDFYRTPNMQRLAAGGIRFNNFAAMSVCSPTRVSIMTGQNAARHRTTNWINPERDNAGPSGPPQWNWRGLDQDDVTLAGVLQDAGYRTIHVGKGHFAPQGFAGADPAKLGFDVNVAGAAFGAPGSYYGSQNYGLGGRRAEHAVPHLEKYHGSETFLTEALTLEANAHVRQAVQADQPFFLYLSHYAVHAPFQSDPRFAANYTDSGTPPAAQAFATLIEGMDKSLGDLLDQLNNLGIAENTLIFFLGDNGSDAPLGHPHEVACAAPLRGKKGSHYEGGTRVPLIVAWAGAKESNPHQQRLQISAGAIQHQLASVEDLFPTIIAISGTETPPAHVVDGVRLDTLLRGERDPDRQERFLMHYPHAPHRSDYFTSYRLGTWKVIYHYFPTEASGNSHYQLFDLAADPFEQRDLAAQRPEELRRMMQELIASLQTHQAVYPLGADGRSEARPQMP
jgi:arylsulfatase A-like enzyme